MTSLATHHSSPHVLARHSSVRGLRSPGLLRTPVDASNSSKSQSRQVRLNSAADPLILYDVCNMKLHRNQGTSIRSSHPGLSPHLSSPLTLAGGAIPHSHKRRITRPTPPGCLTSDQSAIDQLVKTELPSLSLVQSASSSLISPGTTVRFFVLLTPSVWIENTRIPA